MQYYFGIWTGLECIVSVTPPTIKMETAVLSNCSKHSTITYTTSTTLPPSIQNELFTENIIKSTYCFCISDCCFLYTSTWFWGIMEASSKESLILHKIS